ncbi:MAG: uracil-DNA glycosylase family protein [Acidobacteriota bacterium]|nr:uracil-DNA glycosylase family protein [Acidobacteriota bacterium]
MTGAFADHLAALYACRACPNVFGEPVTGAVPDSKVMLVGQAPGPHEVEDRRPFAYTAGQRLFSWFEEFGVGEPEFRSSIHICAVIRCFPGRNAKGSGDRVPNPAEIANCGAHLDREIRILQPELVIAVGTLAAQQLIGESELRSVVGPVHRAERAGVAFDVVVLPHPSGRSTWLNDPKNRAMLRKAMQAITAHRAWRATFRLRRMRRA